MLAIASTMSLALLAQPRQAAAVEISGSGVWGATTPVSTYSAPNDSFSFSFDLPSPTESNPSSLITNLTYDLNGVDVASTADAPLITFYDTANGGLFDLFFQTSGDDVSFEGAQIGSDASGTDTGGGPVFLTDAIDTPFLATLDFGSTPTGSGTLSVPEPGSMLILSAGLVALRAARRRTRGKTTA
jgi:hypothetical protein